MKAITSPNTGSAPQADNSAGLVRTFYLYWSPEGRRIATVTARDSASAKRKAPQPYRKFLGEIYTVEAGNE